MNAKKILAMLVLVLSLVALLASCNDTPAEHEHVYSDWSMTTVPTETTAGAAERKCYCGDTNTSVVPALNDSAVWTKAVTNPTHIYEGVETYTSEYGKVEITIDQLPHEWKYEITTTPSATVAGEAFKTCACGGFEVVALPALEDTTVWSTEVTVVPSHVSEGVMVYTAKDYGNVTVSVVLGMTDSHGYGNTTVVTEPTETTAGVAERACPCGDKITVEIPSLLDTSVWTLTETVNPTHLVEGKKVYTSKEFGTVNVAISKTTAHTFGAWTITVAPTETVTGEAIRECACGKQNTGVVPVLTDASVWTSEITVAPSHLVEGVRTYTCEKYGSFTAPVPTTPEHDAYGAWTLVVAPTETETGTATHICACGHEDTGVVPVLTDSIWTTSVATAPTYNDKGVMAYTSEYGVAYGPIAKLVAPYDGKTYANLVFDGELEDSNKAITAQDTWANAVLTLDENGFGFCQSYPYRGFTQITMVDAETGRINITIYEILSTDDEGNPVPNYDAYVVYPAYVDFETGIIVRARNSAFNYVVLYTPFETDPSYTSAIASSWNGDAMAITYTVNNVAYNVYCTVDNAYIGTTFTDMAGNAVAANTCYNAPYVYVKDSAGKLIASYGYDGKNQCALDGYEGTYTNATLGNLFLSGFGTATIGGESGSYTVEGGKVNVFVKNDEGKVTGYYLVTLGNGTYTYTIPKVTVSFETNGYATQGALEFTKYVNQTLPTYTHATMSFKGWYYDAACTQPVGNDFVPTTDVTLYAKWKEKVVINLVGIMAGDNSVIYLGEDDVIGEFLPVYTLDVDNYKKFNAWYVDANGNGVLDDEDFALDLETTISAEDTGATVIAKWDDLPAYYGTYYGVEIWNASYGNSSKSPITIDENGNISGFKNGVILSYDPETQVVQWQPNNSTYTYTFYFDAETGVIAGMYSNYDIGNDYYLYSRYTEATNGKVNAHYGVKAPKAPGSSSIDWYAQFVDVATKLGQNTTLFLYNNHIYNDVTITTTTGEALTPATVKDAKTVVVVDNKTGNIIVAVASLGNSFAANNNTTSLDAYFGNYTMGGETVVLDGTGTIIYAGKTGTYTATDAGFDVYFAEDGVNTEYYQMTLDTAAKTATLTKVMVNVTLDVDGKNVQFTQIGATNANIAITLPSLSCANFVFRGWYVQGDVTKTPVGDSYVPTADVTLVALWKAEYTLTVVYNNGNANSEIIFGEGEIATLDQPSFAKHKFDGWFTTATFEAGTEWANGSAITEDTVIYAMWSEAPVYNLTYTVTEIERKNDSNFTDLFKFYTRTAANFTIDPDGKSPKTSYPFATGDITITNYDPATGSLTFNCGSKSYKGYVDSVTGIIVVNYQVGDADMQDFFFLNPFESTSVVSKMTGSYWNNGSTACIVYTYDDNTTYTIFVNNNVVYFGVSFVDANGNAVAGDACYQSGMLYVNDAEGNLIAYFAYNGESMVELDGNEGTYTGSNGDLVMSGYGTLTMSGLNGSYTQNTDGTFSVLLYNADGSVNMYYVVNINKTANSYTASPVPVTLTFVSAYGAAAAQSAFAYVPSTLPTLAQTGFVFRGWYVQGDASETIVDASAFVTGESVTLVAKWDAMLSFTVVYGNTLETVVNYYGAGDTPVLVDPAYTNGKAFNGWFLDADCTVAYTTSVITENTTVYAKWIEAHPMYGSYTGSNVYGGSSTGSTNSGGSSNVNIVIDALGNVTGKTTGQIRDYDPETGMFKLYPDDSKYYLGVFDAKTGIMIFNYSTGKTNLINDVYIYAPGSTFKCNSELGCYWNGGKTKIGTIRCDAGNINYFMFEDRIYTNISWASDDGEVTSNYAYNANNLYVYDSEGNLLAYFAKESGKGLVYKVSDGLAGSYTDGQNALVLDGYGAGTLNGSAMTYTADGNKLLVVVGKAYYEVTLSGSSCTVNHLQYTVKFVTGIDGYTIDDMVVEYNADLQLPSSHSVVGYKFEGWYTTPDFSERVYWYDGENTDMTYYAKWSSVCSLTMVYGDGIANSIVSYGSGETVTLGTSLSPDGTGLYIWFADEACTQPFTSATISGNMTVYGVKVATVSYGYYDFVEKDGKLVSDNKSVGSSTASMTITLLGNYTVTYNYTVSSESGWDKASIKENGTTTVNNISGSQSGSITTTLVAGDTITFSYSKDSSGNSGDDCLTVTLTFN